MFIRVVAGDNLTQQIAKDQIERLVGFSLVMEENGQNGYSDRNKRLSQISGDSLSQDALQTSS